MHSIKNTPVCPSCHNYFSVKTSEDTFRKYQKKKYRSFQPRILVCGHNLCEECLRSVRGQSHVPCPVCRVDTILPEGMDDGIGKVPLDLYTSGVILNNSLFSPIQNIMPKMVPAGYSMMASKKEPRLSPSSSSSSCSEVTICAECTTTAAVWRCRQCTFNLCNPCFVKVHKTSKLLSKHEAMPMVQESGCHILRVCDEHSQPLEFYCTDDDHVVCSHCLIMGSHKNHSNVTLRTKNMGYLEELSLLTEKVQKVSKHLKKAEKKLNCCNAQPAGDGSEVIKKINAAFQQLHGLLQLRELKLISEVEDMYSIYKSPKEKLKTEIADSLKHIKVLLKDADLAKQVPEKFDIKQLMKKLHKMSNISCHLITTDEQEPRRIKFDLDKESLSFFNQVGKIHGSLPSEYKLLRTDELPPGFDISDNDDESVISDTSSKLSLLEYDSTLEQKDSNSVQESKDQQNLSQIQLLKQEMVYVTHIVNPHLFMVQRCQEAGSLLSLSKQITEWCKDSSKATSLTSVSKGDLVLAQYSKDDLWYRARVKKIIQETAEENEDTSDSIEGVEVCYIDYGNSEVISLSRLRAMESEFLELPEMTLKCSLYDIIPKDKSWCLDAIEMMRMFTGDKPVQMCVMEEVNGIYQVDLRRPPALTLSINDTPTSIRDALVFLQFAYFASDCFPFKVGIPHQQYLSPIPHKKFRSLNVAASYADNPSTFYVQQTGENWNSLSSLMFSMQEKYKGDAKSNLWTIFCPQKDMPCVAQYSHDRQWYRAQVVELIGGTKVKVKYVDYGNEEILPWSSLKKIADEYLKLPIQAIRCSLIDVEPLEGTEWSTKACIAFNNMLAKKELKIYIKGETDTALLVVLYENRSDAYICINTLLVSKSLAKSTGPNSTILKFAAETKENDSEVAVKAKTLEVKNSLSPIKPKPTIVRKPDHPEMVLVKVTAVESPDCLYVQLIGENEDDLDRLMRDMQKTYRQSEWKPHNWKSEDIIAAKLPKDQRWYRARVLGVVDDLIKILAVDYGLTATVPVADVRLLLNQFQVHCTFAISCCLTGIQPAGGTSEWTKSACEFLHDTLHVHERFYMAKKGSSKNGRLSIDLYVEDFKQGGALEPHISVFQSITDILLEEGMALRSRSPSPTLNDSSVASNLSKLVISINDLSHQVTNLSLDSPNEEKVDMLSVTPTEIVEAAGSSKSGDEQALHQLMEDGALDDNGGEDENDDDEEECLVVPNPVRTDDVIGNETSQLPIKGNLDLYNEEDYEDDDDYEDYDSNEEPEVPTLQVNNNAAIYNSNGVIVNKSPEESKLYEDIKPLKGVPCEETKVKKTDVVWKKSELPKETVFEAVVTYIDYDGCIYLHDVTAKPMLEYIKNELKNKFGSSKPEDHDFYWEADEPCIAQYHLDGCWYRAQVKKVTDKGVELVFIDYGNTETVDPLKIRKKIACQALPRQSLKCMLHGIKPMSENSLWPEQILEVLHNQIVDQEVTVVLKEPPKKEPLQVSISLANNKCSTLEDWLIEMELAERRTLPPPCFSPLDYTIEDQEDDLLELSPFYGTPLPSLGENISAVVTNIEFPSMVWLQRKYDEDSTNPQQMRIKEQCSKFLDMCQQINKEVSKWNTIPNPKIGEAVCSHYSVDNQWYRALVKVVESNAIRVLYVDYGNEATVQSHEIRELPAKYLNIPMQALRCQLHQLAPTNGQWTEEIFHELEAVISDNQGDVICCIRELTNPVKVDLYKNLGDCYHSQLVYQNLIDKGIMTLVREKTSDELL